MLLPVTQSSETSTAVSAESVVVVVVVVGPDGRVAWWFRWRMDKMDVVRDEVNVLFLSSSTAASEFPSLSELLAHCFSSKRAEGFAKLLMADVWTKEWKKWESY